MIRRNRGSVLVLALMISAAAAIAGMWLVLTTDLRSRANRYLGLAGHATRNALSGIEIARLELAGDESWDGDTFSIGAESGLSGSAEITAEPSGVLRSDVSSLGRFGDSKQSILAELRAPPDPALQFNVISATTVTFDDASVGGQVRSNGNVTVVGDVDFSGTLETIAGSTVGAGISASQIAWVSEVITPPPVDVDALVAYCSTLMGVPFDVAENALLLSRVRLTPAYSPYGGVNASGAYVLDADGRRVVIRDVYVKGMLVIRNADGVTIESGYHHERADISLPTLVVEGALQLRLEDSLYEMALVMDLNGDGDMVDVHAPLVDGVVIATGALSLPYGGTLKGSAMGNSVTIVGFASLVDQAQLASQPVRQFTEPGAWDVVPGSIGDGN